MGRGRRFDKKCRMRPKKVGGERKRKESVQKKRLIGLGMPADVAEKLNPKIVRDILKRPTRVATAIKVFTSGKVKK